MVGSIGQHRLLECKYKTGAWFSLVGDAGQSVLTTRQYISSYIPFHMELKCTSLMDVNIDLWGYQPPQRGSIINLKYSNEKQTSKQNRYIIIYRLNIVLIAKHCMIYIYPKLMNNKIYSTTT